jgi:anti-sigma B factor antagonist
MVQGSDPRDDAESPGELLAVTAESHGTDLVVGLRGELDEATATHVWQVLEIELGQGPPRVVLDLSKLSFLSSAGVAVIIRLVRHLDASGAELVIREPSRNARRVLDVTGLTARLTIEG